MWATRPACWRNRELNHFGKARTIIGCRLPKPAQGRVFPAARSCLGPGGTRFVAVNLSSHGRSAVLSGVDEFPRVCRRNGAVQLCGYGLGGLEKGGAPYLQPTANVEKAAANPDHGDHPQRGHEGVPVHKIYVHVAIAHPSASDSSLSHIL